MQTTQVAHAIEFTTAVEDIQQATPLISPVDPSLLAFIGGGDGLVAFA